MPSPDTVIATHPDKYPEDLNTQKDQGVSSGNTPLNGDANPEDAQGLTSNLSPAWTVSNYFIKINGCDVNMNDVLDLEIMFGGDEIPAVLTLQDSEGHLTGVNGKVPIAAGGTVHIQYDSVGNCHYEDEFVITKVTFSTDERNRKVVVILMKDKDSVAGMVSYVSKGYQGKSHSEVVQEHRKEMGTKKELIIAEPKDAKEKKVNTTIPAHVDNHTAIKKLNEKNGYEIVKDKQSHYLVHKDEKTFDKLKFKGEIFEADVANQHSIHRILQFNFKGYDFDALMRAAPARITSNKSEDVNANTKDNKKDPKAKGENLQSKSEIVKGLPTSKALAVRGERQSSTNQSNEKQSFNVLQNLNAGSIWVPGVNVNRIGFKIQIIFPKPLGYYGVDENDNYSTFWEVYAIRDKVIKNFFVQELFVRNPGMT